MITRCAPLLFFNCSTLSKNLKKRYILKRSFNQHLMILNNFKNPLEELYHSVSSVQSKPERYIPIILDVRQSTNYPRPGIIGILQ